MQIKIHNAHYKVFFVENVNYYGYTNCGLKMILINIKDVCTEQIEKVIIHELVHAFCYEYCLTGHYTKSTEKTISEEMLCDIIAYYSLEILDLKNKIYKKYRESYAKIK